MLIILFIVYISIPVILIILFIVYISIPVILIVLFIVYISIPVILIILFIVYISVPLILIKLLIIYIPIPVILPAGDQQAASSVHYTTSCKHSLVLVRMGEIMVRNILSWLKLLIQLLLLHLVGCFYYCINDARSHKHQKIINHDLSKALIHDPYQPYRLIRM